MKASRLLIVCAFFVLPALHAWASPSATHSGHQVPAAQGAPLIKFTDVEKQTREFIGHEKTIKLTAAQEAIKSEALGSIKAVCCEDFSALTCCCPCNFSKSLWGMSAYLIAEKHANAKQVKEAALAWIKFVNPSGFSGDSCFTGGCVRPFANNGCGGMNENDVQF